MPKNCTVPNCRTAPGDRKSFYKFPLHDPERLDLWLRNIGRKNWSPSRHQYICHRHFAPSDFKVCSGVHHLKNTAVPTLFQKAKVVGENERSQWHQANYHQSIKRLTPESAVSQLDDSVHSELCNLEQICDFGEQGTSQQDIDLPILKDLQMTLLQTSDDSTTAEECTKIPLEYEDQYVSTTCEQTDEHVVDMDELTCTIIDFSNHELDQTPDTVCFEVIPSIFSGLSPQLTYVPETVLSSALNPQPITSTLPIVSKHVQSSKVDKSPETEEEEEDDIILDNDIVEHQQQVEHCYHKSSISKEQLEDTVLDLQRKVKTLQQHHNRYVDKVQELEMTVGQLRQTNLLYKERLQLLERAFLQANAPIAGFGEIVTIIYEEENPEHLCTNVS